MLSFIKETVSLWDVLKNTEKPIVLYGMGDGAQKIIDRLDAFGVRISDIFASDEFVRGHSFAGMRVKKFDEIRETYPDFVILISFAVDYEPMLSKLFNLSEKYEVYAPDVPLFGGGTFNLDYVNENEDKIKKAHSLLADSQSMRVFENVINFKISGNLKYLKDITTLRECDLKEIFDFSESERYLDLGAYDGDTVREFVALANGRFESATALEPDKKNFRKLLEFSKTDSRITPVCKAIWDRAEALPFSGRAGRNSSFKDGGKQTVETVTVDFLSEEYTNSKGFTLIKADVEGAEKQMLLGAKKEISAHSPKLFVSAYHRNEDIFALPLLVHELNPHYKIYLRKHPYVPAWEVNILARL